jgi:glycosyltransferase 2 family protein
LSARGGSRGAWATGLVVLAGVVAFAIWHGEEHRFETIIRRAEPAWLLTAVVLQAGTYFATAAMWHRVLAWAREPSSLGSLVPLSLAKLFTDQMVPSGGISGSTLVVSALRKRGTSTPTATATVLVSFVAYYLAYAAALAVALAILWMLGDLGVAVLALAAVLLVLAIGVTLAIRWISRRGSRPLPRWVAALPVARAFLKRIGEAPPQALSDRGLLAAAAGLQLLVFALDGSTLWAMLRAVGWHADPGVIFAAFMIASVAGTIGIVPGGLGTFEGTCVAMLHVVGVPVADALTATLLLRGFTFWLPMLPGLWLTRRVLGNAVGPRRG